MIDVTGTHLEYRKTLGYEETGPSFINVQNMTFKVQHPVDGEWIGPCRREVIQSKPSVGILPYGGGMVFLLRQFRMPVFMNEKIVHDGWLYEIPAGIVDNGSSYDAAQRELVEETGILVSNLKHFYKVASCYMAPGISTEKMTIFTVNIHWLDIPELPESIRGGLNNEHEAIVGQWLSHNEVRELIFKEQIMDAKTLIALSSLGIA